VQKVLEDANVKIGDVLCDVFGLSGQLMLDALVNGLGEMGRRALSTSRNSHVAMRGRRSRS